MILFGEISITIDNLIPETMKGVNCDSIRILSNHTRKAFSHILRGVIRKGETEDVRWEIIGCLQYIGYTGRKQLSLSASWSCNDKYWSIDSLHCFSLTRIERCEDVREGFVHTFNCIKKLEQVELILVRVSHNKKTFSSLYDWIPIPL